MVAILGGSQDRRANHWKEIASKVRTHEGELLTGSQGAKYQEKWSKKMLGKDLSGSRANIDKNLVERYEKTGR